MSACNQMFATANKVTMIRRIKSRKSVSSSHKKNQNVAAVVHQTNNSLPSTAQESFAESPKFMNTYRLEPKIPFDITLIYGVMEEIVQKHCFGVKYDYAKCVSKVKSIAGEVMERVKNFQFDRYRIIVFVQIGENQRQEFQTAVKFLWDSSKDNFATYQLTGGSIFTTVTCFGVYLD